MPRLLQRSGHSFVQIAVMNWTLNNIDGVCGYCRSPNNENPLSASAPPPPRGAPYGDKEKTNPRLTGSTSQEVNLRFSACFIRHGILSCPR